MRSIPAEFPVEALLDHVRELVAVFAEDGHDAGFVLDEFRELVILNADTSELSTVVMGSD